MNINLIYFLVFRYLVLTFIIQNMLLFLSRLKIFRRDLVVAFGDRVSVRPYVYICLWTAYAPNRMSYNDEIWYGVEVVRVLDLIRFPRSSKVIMGHWRPSWIIGQFFLLHIYAFWDVANVLRQTYFFATDIAWSSWVIGGHLELLAKIFYCIFTHFGTLRTFWGKLFFRHWHRMVSVRPSVCAHLLVNSIRAKPYELQWRNLVWSWSSTSSRSD